MPHPALPQPLPGDSIAVDRHRHHRRWYWLSMLWLGVIGAYAGCAPATPAPPAPPGPTQQALLTSSADELGEPARSIVASLLDQSAGAPGRWRWPGSDKQLTALELAQGADLFGRQCAACHGVWGAGDGPLAPLLAVAPRDFRRGVFKFQSTFYGAKPLIADLEHTINHGLPGTSMPRFAPLGPARVAQLARYVVWLARRGEVERELVLAAQSRETLSGELLVEIERGIQSAWEEASQQTIPIISRDSRPTSESIARGRKAFSSRGCSKCHGPDGRGETEENLRGGLRDYWGEPVRAADLTSGFLKGGRRPDDVYRRILGGINGTPMPSFRATLMSEPETVWDLVDFVLDLPDKSHGPDASTP